MCVYFRGIGAGRCPFFIRLNSVPAFNDSDRMCVRLPIVPSGALPNISPRADTIPAHDTAAANITKSQVDGSTGFDLRGD